MGAFSKNCYVSSEKATLEKMEVVLVVTAAAAVLK